MLHFRPHSAEEKNHGLLFELPDDFLLPEPDRLSDYPVSALKDTWYLCRECGFRYADHDNVFKESNTRFVAGTEQFLCRRCVMAKRKQRREHTAAALHQPAAMKGKR